jgi:large subunit ribosomal protein L19
MGQHPLLREIESSYRRTDLPDLRAGDSVRVHTLIKEGDKERVQIFEGVVIGQHRGGSRASFTVRKVSYGVGVERIFPLHTSRIEKIESSAGARFGARGSTTCASSRARPPASRARRAATTRAPRTAVARRRPPLLPTPRPTRRRSRSVEWATIAW